MTRAIVKGFKKLIIVPRDPASFTRSSPAYNPEDGSQVAVNEPRYVEGPWAGSKALLVEEGTTNLFKNASFEVYTGMTGVADGWASAVSSGTATFSVVTSPIRPSGSKAQKVSNSGMASAGHITDVHQDITGLYGGQPYSLSGYFNVESLNNAYVQIYVDFRDAASAWLGGNSRGHYSTTAGFIRLCISGTTPAGTARCQAHAILRATAAGGSGTFYVDDMQYEVKPHPTSIILANDTTTQATRSPETLTIPTAGVLNPQEGTVEVTVIPNLSSSATPSSVLGFHDLVWMTTDASKGFIVRRKQGGIEMLSRRSAGHQNGFYPVTWNVGDKLSIAVKWDSAKLYLLVNGQLAITLDKFDDPGSVQLYIGSRADAPPQGNALYADLRISSRARTDAEILAAYQSGQPLPVDEWTTLKVPFDASLAGYGPGYVYVPSNKTRVVGGPRRTKAVLLSRS
ncbi:MAG TPA: hypothetical protein GX512_03780 [Firmicutes bacterium]|nr:hypothetical protein [Candidatus Fermentithermobacillaceae bacterium]